MNDLWRPLLNAKRGRGSSGFKPSASAAGVDGVQSGCLRLGFPVSETISHASGATPVASYTEPILGWQIIASGDEGPGFRSRHGLVYDRVAKAAVLFGGIVWGGQGTLRSDTWELRNGRWTRIRTDKTPPARHRGAMVYLDSCERSLLFGGQGVWNNFLGDTWTYSGQQWRRLRFWMRSPSRRCGHSLAYDEQAGVAVLFGGITPQDRPLGDTWLFDGTSWTKVRGAALPHADTQRSPMTPT